MDEEHDVSYKQDSPMPCYDAREIPIEKLKRNSAKLILGSATPSMQTWKRCIFERNFKLVRMIQRISSCLLYTSPSPRDLSTSRMPSSA